MAVVLKALSLPKIQEIPRLNATPDPPCVSDQTPTIKATLDKLTELDRQLYDLRGRSFLENEGPRVEGGGGGK